MKYEGQRWAIIIGGIMILVSLAPAFNPLIRQILIVLALVMIFVPMFAGEKKLSTAKEEVVLTATQPSILPGVDPIKNISQLEHTGPTLNPKLFEVLDEVWKKLQLANGAVLQALSPFSTSPDFENMNAAELEATISSMNISDLQKSQLRLAKDKHKIFYNIQKWMKISYADECCRDLQNYYHLNRIYFDSELQAEIGPTVDKLYGKQSHARVEHEASMAGARMPPQDQPDLKQNLDKILNMIQKRLGIG
jgi:hypothetical protein